MITKSDEVVPMLSYLILILVVVAIYYKPRFDRWEKMEFNIAR